MIPLFRLNKAAVAGLFILVCIVLSSAWLSNPWAETWDLPQPKTPSTPEVPESRPAESTTNPTSQYRVSKLHYLIPTTKITDAVCASAASALLNRYSIPTIVGYKGTGEFDAKAAHIAKLRTVSRYLHNVENSLDDDLVIIVDGFDVVAQLPAAATIEMYFQLMSESNQRIADRHGLTLKEARTKGMYQTLLWGTDKGCFPGPRSEPQCWLIPDGPSAHNVWGPKTNNGDLPFSPSKFLNSGTVIGPIGDLRALIDKALELIKETWDPEHKFRNSDQFYMSKLYARQEFHRNINLLDKGGNYPGAGPERNLPKKRVDENDQTEFHVTVDFESAFTQTQCHNDIFMHKLMYNNWDNSALMKHDVMGEGEHFKPYHIPMPSSFFKAFLRIYGGFEEGKKPAGSAKDWVRGLRLGTNIATRRIFGFYHNTCSKKHFVERFQTFWFFPQIDLLLKNAARANRAGSPISEDPIDGRMWVDAQHHPFAGDVNDPDGYGGMFTDLEGESYLTYQAACGDSYERVFNKDAPKEEKPKPDEQKPEEPKPEEPKPEEPKPEEPKPEEPKPEEPKPEEPKPEAANPEPPNPEDPKPEDPKPEDPKPEEPKPEEPKPEGAIEPPADALMEEAQMEQ